MARVRRKKAFGSALTEYALPVVGLLVVGGVLASTIDINQYLGAYFMKASGNDKGALQGSTLKAPAMGSSATGDIGSGSQGFSSFGQLADGSGNSIKLGGKNYVYSGPISRGARPQGLGGNGDTLFSSEDQDSLYAQAINLAASGASAEYVARVLQMAALTEQAGNAKLAGNTPVISMVTASQQGQLGSLNAYALSNLDEVLAHGGLLGLAKINLAGQRSIASGVQIEDFYGRMQTDASTSKRLETLGKTIDEMQKESGKKDIDINSPEMKDALKNANLTEADYGALAEIMANLEAYNKLPVGEGLMSTSVASSYMTETSSVPLSQASADYQQSLGLILASSSTSSSSSSSTSTSTGSLTVITDTSPTYTSDGVLIIK
jgi:hypothetical protein